MGLFKSKEQKAAEAAAKQRQQQQAAINKGLQDSMTPKDDVTPYANEKKRRQEEQAAAQHQEANRDEIDEILRNLSKEIALSFPDAEDDAQEIRDLSVRVRRMNLGKNQGATDAIMTFIRAKAQDMIVKAHAGNYAAIIGFFEELKSLVNDAENPQKAKLMADPAYVKRRIRVAELSALKEDLQGQKQALYRQRDKLKARMEAGLIDQREAVSRVGDIRAQVDDLERSLQNAQSDLRDAQTVLTEQETQIRNSTKAKAEDINDYNAIADQKADAEALSSEKNDVMSQIRQNNADVSMDDMHMHASTGKTELSQEQVDNAFDF